MMPGRIPLLSDHSHICSSSCSGIFFWPSWAKTCIRQLSTGFLLIIFMNKELYWAWKKTLLAGQRCLYHIYVIHVQYISTSLLDRNSDWLFQRATTSFTAGEVFIVALFQRESTDSQFIHKVCVCAMTLNARPIQPCKLNKRYRAPSIEHHGGLEKSWIYSFLQQSIKALPALWEKGWVRKSKATAVVCKNPRTAVADLFCLRSLDSFPSLTSPFPLAMSLSLSLHNYLL